MESIYFIFVIVLLLLAVFDLIVGVGNDAVNFLNAAIGSRAASLKTIIIVAGLGVLAGAIISGGMMEVARKGIFHPELFNFHEIMIIFMAVMLTDVVLLDTFNSFGMPTSTTVSIVFELLGAAVGMAALKVYTGDITQGAEQVGDYINSSKALLIIGGILLSVVVAFTAGVIFQFVTRLIFTFDYRSRMKYFGGIGGGFAFTSIIFFILIKGAKNMPFMSTQVKNYIMDHTSMILLSNFIIWSIVLQILYKFFKIDIFKIIVIIGTFALALAFAGNDLVNFIGVPIAGYEAFESFKGQGVSPTELLMSSLAQKEKAPMLFLTLAGIIMVLTIWFSKKARKVVKTSLDLGRQEEGFERFGSSMVSRAIVRASTKIGNKLNDILPDSFNQTLVRNFDIRPFNERVNALPKEEAPAFDMVRASVTLVLASILITLGTMQKLPLSTTYVTFMVAMGTSLADGAWGRESAVYRVSGVMNVILGWFFTAFSAFTIAFLLVLIFMNLGNWAIFVMILLAFFILYKSHLNSKDIEENQIDDFDLGSEDNIDKSYLYDKGVKYTNRLLQSVMSTLNKSRIGLEKEDVKGLEESKNEFKKVFEKIKRVNNKISYNITRLKDEDEESGLHYIKSMYFLHEIALSNNRILRPVYEYIANSHKPILPQQHEDLSQAVNMVNDSYQNALKIINNNDYEKVDELLDHIDKNISALDGIRKKQVKRIKNKEVGTRNSVLFFDAISEIRHLMIYIGKFMRSFKKLHETLETPSENI